MALDGCPIIRGHGNIEPPSERLSPPQILVHEHLDLDALGILRGRQMENLRYGSAAKDGKFKLSIFNRAQEDSPCRPNVAVSHGLARLEARLAYRREDPT